ncbi:MAG: hypothetical protein R3C05_20215 [Pirellulaceae bacterium]
MGSGDGCGLCRPEVQSLKAFRTAETERAQALIAGELVVRWGLLADAAKGPIVWKAIARQMGPQALCP